MSLLITDNLVLQTLAITLLHFLWQGLLIAVLTKLFLIIISTKRPTIRYGVLCGAMLTSLLLPLLTFNYFYQADSYQGLVENQLFTSNLPETLQQHSASDWLQQVNDYLPYLSVVWLFWVVFLTCKMLLEMWQIQQLPYKNVISTEPELLSRFQQLAQQIGLKRAPKLIISLTAQVPMALGWLKPTVLMPAQMLLGLSQEQLEMLILHELAHIKRYDYLINFLQTLIEILLFFHPAVLWISKQMRQEREYCSDDIAVHHSGSPIAYAHTLADTATLCKSHRHTIPTMAMAASGGDLKARVVRLVNHSCSSQNSSGQWLAGITILLAIGLTASKQLITLPFYELSNISVNLLQGTQGQAQVTDFRQNKSQQFSQNEPKIGEQAHSRKEAALATKESNEQLRQTSELALQPIASPDLSATELNTGSSTLLPSSLNESGELDQLTEDKNLTASTNNQLSQTDSQSNVDLDAAFDEIEQLATQNTKKRYSQAPHQLDQHQGENTLFSSTTLDGNKATLANNTPSSEVALFEQRYINQTAQSHTELFEQQEAKLLTSVEPRYPSIAKRNGYELDVMVNFTIDKKGRVIDIEFEQLNRLNYFKGAITTAMKQWRFEPARVNGEPVTSTMAKIFSFNMD
ncbi:M56 family metallopeptidase [Colwellia sp. MEBiC06753]